MKCPSCGFEIPEGKEVCPKCGFKVPKGGRKKRWVKYLLIGLGGLAGLVASVIAITFIAGIIYGILSGIFRRDESSGWSSEREYEPVCTAESFSWSGTLSDDGQGYNYTYYGPFYMDANDTIKGTVSAVGDYVEIPENLIFMIVGPANLEKVKEGWMEDIYGYEIKNLSGEDHFIYSPTKSAEYYLVFLIWNFEPFYYDFVVNGEVISCE